MENLSVKVSVVMPIYNASEYLGVAIDSVLSQTFSDIELICVDDGSTDSSLAILKEYQARDERVRIVPENNAGPSVACAPEHDGGTYVSCRVHPLLFHLLVDFFILNF